MAGLPKTIVLRLVDWVTRPRNVGLKLMALGGLLIGLAAGADVIGQVNYRDGLRSLDFKVATGDAVPPWMLNSVYGIGIVVLAVGLVLLLHDFVVAARERSRKLVVVVEVRGLHSSPDTPAKNIDLGRIPGRREWLQLDFRPKSEADPVDPALAVQKIETLKGTLQTLAAGRDPSDVTIAAGGLAAVPALFLLGMLLDDESHVPLYDWHRDAREWMLADGADDGKRLEPVDYSAVPAAPGEVVLAVSLSYLVDRTAVEQTFPSLPVVELRAQQIATDRYWSIAKQQFIAAAFRAAVQELLHRGVRRIHLVLAAPASLSIRLGMSYDRRLLPEVLVYQYERSARMQYPWALVMPTHGRAQAEVARRP